MTNPQATWRHALTQRAVWRRSLIIGLSVGAVQIAVNQGDVWLHHEISLRLVVKTLVTPLIAISVALFSGAGAYLEIQKQQISRQAEASLS